MTTSGYQFISRPYPYSRHPFILSSGEKVPYYGEFFSQPAYALLFDKRLFSTVHPVLNSTRVYINKNTNLSLNIEPTFDASGYQSGTPHYVDYILNLRTLLQEVITLHSNDSNYSINDFLSSHLERNRDVYNLPNSSASGISNLEFIHASPSNTVPINNELGANQLYDIDIDEILWQPFTRPKSLKIGPGNMVIEPFFPLVLPNGQLPSFSSLDEEKFDELAINISNSGGVLITGDALVNGTSIKLITVSGQQVSDQGNFVSHIEWSQFPAASSLNLYYPTENNAQISASGRQAIYNIPPNLTNDLVYCLDVSNINTSGKIIQYFPHNYYASSGINADGIAHHGIHTVDRLLYNINEFIPNNLSCGRSLINGKKIFGHFIGNEVSSKGFSIGGKLKYFNNNTLYTYGGITIPLVTSTTTRNEWGFTNNQLSPITWTLNTTSALGPVRGIFGARDYVQWDVADIMASNQGIVWFKKYQPWGTMDRIIFPGADFAGNGELTTDIITYTTIVYREGVDEFGRPIWIEMDPPDSPIVTTQEVKHYRNTYEVNNLISNYFGARPNYGFVNVNGQVYLQWSDSFATFPKTNKFVPISSAQRHNIIVPETNRTVRTVVVGFFPSWRVRLHVTTNNQVSVTHRMGVTPAASTTITFAPDIPISMSNVNTFGPATWDEETGLNYLYFSLKNNAGFYFAKMNTNFEIIHINSIDANDAILTGRTAIISVL